MALAEATRPSSDDGGVRPPTPAAASGGKRIAALDGLRGFALVGMLLWHAEVAWVQGGFARMTIFFALSGYLATLSWIRIRARQGELGGFREFWWRRARRLLPISFLGIAAAVAVTTAWGTPGMRNRLGGDVLSVLGYVSNIRFWRSEQSYGELFDEPSLLQHYWTLSIEEQAFFVLPLLLAGVALVTRGRTRHAAAVVAVVTVVCAGFPAVVDHTPDAVWYSSIVRFGEFCSGVALALWTADRAGGRVGGAPHRLLGLAGALGLVALAVVMVTIPRDADWLYQGGMSFVIVPTVAVLAAAARSAGPSSWVLSLRPLTALGRWTFSIYVLHWPLFWVLDGARLGLDGWQLASVRLAASVVVGAVVHVLVERPLMARGPLTRGGTGFAGALGRRDALDLRLARLVPAGWWRTRPAAATLAVSAVALAVVGFLPSGQELYDFEAMQRVQAGNDEDPDADEWVRLSELQMFAPDEGELTVGIYGGSTSLILDLGAAEWFRASEDIAIRPGASPLGCALVADQPRRTQGGPRAGDFELPPEICEEWPDLWRRVAEVGRPQVALIGLGVWDTGDFLVDGSVTRVGDRAFDQLLLDKLETARALFVEAGVEQVQLLTTPQVRRGVNDRIWRARGFDESHPDRVQRFNELLAAFADRHDDVAVVDYGGWIAGLGDDRVRRLLPDGLHASAEGATHIWDEFLGEAVLETHRSR